MRGLAVLGLLCAIAVLVEPYALFVVGALICFYARSVWRDLLLEGGDA